MKLNLSLAWALALVQAPLSVDAGGFLGSCCQISFSGTTVYAKCRNDAGQWVNTNKNVHYCIANYNGQLSFAVNGGYSASCWGCIVSDQLNIHCPGSRRIRRALESTSDVESPNKQLEIRDTLLAKRLDTTHWVLGCTCRKGDGSNQISYIPLDVVLSNWNGNLGC